MSSKSSKTDSQVANLIDALDDVPIAPEDAKETVAKLGIDVKGLAAGIRAKVAAADAADRQKQKVAAARDAYAKEIERLALRKPEPKRERDEHLAVLSSLLARAPQSVAMHFHKYEAATDDELAELIRSLRHLLGEGE